MKAGRQANASADGGGIAVFYLLRLCLDVWWKSSINVQFAHLWVFCAAGGPSFCIVCAFMYPERRGNSEL